MKEILDYDYLKAEPKLPNKLVSILYYMYCIAASQHIIYSTLSLIDWDFSVWFFLFSQFGFIVLSLFFIFIEIHQALSRLSKLILIFNSLMLIVFLILIYIN